MNAAFIDALKNPRIPGFEWPEPEDEGDRKMFRDILEHGCQILAIEAGPQSPDFSYSVGLHLNFLHPEILILGVSAQTCHQAINQICREAAQGKIIKAGDTRTDLAGFSRAARFVECPHRFYPDYLGYAVWFYRSLFFRVAPVMEFKFPVLQIHWCDKSGLYPDDPNCNEAVRKVQTLVVKPSSPR